MILCLFILFLHASIIFYNTVCDTLCDILFKIHRKTENFNFFQIVHFDFRTFELNNSQ